MQIRTWRQGVYEAIIALQAMGTVTINVPFERLADDIAEYDEAGA